MKRRRFEDRLERELIAAARRQAEEAGDATPQRARLRIAVGGVAAVATIALLTGVLLLGSPGSEPPRPAATVTMPIPPGVCPSDPLTDRALPQVIRSRFALLRRPQTAADRAVCIRAPFGADMRANPAELRLAAHGPGSRDEVRVGSSWSGDVPYLCIEHHRPGATFGSTGCGPADDVALNGLSVFGANAMRTGRFLFLVPDGVATVELRYADGSARRLPVRGNVASLLARGVFQDPSSSSTDYALLDADGEVLTVARAAR